MRQFGQDSPAHLKPCDMEAHLTSALVKTELYFFLCEAAYSDSFL